MHFNDSPEDNYIQSTISNNRVVCFNKSWCPYCKKVESALVENEIIFHSVYLDQMDDFGARLQEKLKQLTNQATVPNVFINGHHVGGCSELLQAFADGTIFEMLNNDFENYEFDLVAIGGGSGGLAAVKEASKFGKRVAVIDFVTPTPTGTTWGLGGTCVNVGCIPKKLMHRAALIHDDMKDAALFGWEFSFQEGKHNWKRMVENIQQYIRSLNWNYKKQLRQKNVQYFNALAQFKDRHTIELHTSSGSKTQTISAKNFLIAVGGRPHYPEFPGSKKYCITSDDLFSLEKFPGKTLLIGGSYIALECAGFLHGVGARCTVMVRSILLRGFDRTMAEKVGNHMKDIGVEFIYECTPTKVTPVDSANDFLKVEGIYADGRRFEDIFETVILAAGRNACTDTLGLEEINIDLNPKNRKVIVDAFDRTSVKTIFAIGDVVDGKPELTPVAIQAGTLLAQRLYGSSLVKMDWMFIPTTVFTPLEYGCVGLSEEEAAKETKVEVFHGVFQPLEKVLGGVKTNCYAKLVCDAAENKEMRVLGLHILGPNAGEITQGFALALKLGATKKQFDDLIGIHPTCAEVFTTLNVTKSSGAELSSSGC